MNQKTRPPQFFPCYIQQQQISICPMLPSRWVVASLIAALGMGGCTSSLYTVKDDANAGIPFFPIHQAIATTEVRAERWWQVQATVVSESLPDLTEYETAKSKAEDAKEAAQRRKKEAEAKKDSRMAKAEQATIDKAELEIEKASQAEKTAEDGFRKKTPAMSQTLALYYNTEQEAANVLLTFNSKDRVEDAWAAVQSYFLDRSLSHVPPDVASDALKKAPGTQLSVERKRIQIIDTQPRSLNVETPWFGTSNATITLASNGTLSSAQAQRDPQVAALATAAGSIAAAAFTPLGTVVAAKITADSALQAARVTAAGAVQAAQAAQAAAELVLPGQPRRYSFVDLKKYLPRTPPPHITVATIKSTAYMRRYSCTTETDLTATKLYKPSDPWCMPEKEGVSYKIDVVHDEDKSKSDDDGNKAISVTGKIQLPKPDQPTGK